MLTPVSLNPNSYLLRVYAGRRFVHHQDPTVPQDGPRETQQLALTGTEVRPPLGHLGVESTAGRLNHLPQLNLLCKTSQLRWRKHPAVMRAWVLNI